MRKVRKSKNSSGDILVDLNYNKMISSKENKATTYLLTSLEMLKHEDPDGFSSERPE